MILLIDNYDSFVHNLARYVRRCGFATQVIRNDQISIDDVRGLAPQAILISPGPCTPNEAGISLSLVQELSGAFPLIGICLGHQAIVQALGGEIVRANEPVHGRSSLIHHDGSELFEGVPSPFPACRYHSLIARREGLPECLEINAWTEDGTIMGVRHRRLPVLGLQFHPESVLTLDGMTILRNGLSTLGIGSVFY
jgi:anthranilate synthase/aminodeoxychorismate synthase-like glutamine amidotransferase